MHEGRFHDDHRGGGFPNVGGFHVPYDEDEERMAHHWTGLTHHTLRKILRTEVNAEEALLNIQRRGQRVDQLTSELSSESNPIRKVRIRHQLRGEARWLEAYFKFFKTNFPIDHEHRTRDFEIRYRKTLHQHQNRRRNAYYSEDLGY